MENSPNKFYIVRGHCITAEVRIRTHDLLLVNSQTKNRPQKHALPEFNTSNLSQYSVLAIVTDRSALPNG